MTIHRALGTRGRVMRDHPQKLCAYCTACSCGYVSPEVATVEVARSFLSDHLRDAKSASARSEGSPQSSSGRADGGFESVRGSADSTPSI